jgi:hypothetical protein
MKKVIKITQTLSSFFAKSLGRTFQMKRIIKEEDFYKFLDLITSSQSQVPLIRVGGEGDGGYLVPDLLGEIDLCYSPGVGNTINFELDLLGMGIPSYLTDASIEKLPKEVAGLNFQSKHLGMWNSERFTTLSEWISITAPYSSNLLLQMDIEGQEYGVLLTTAIEDLKRFKILVIEFHELNQTLNRNGMMLVYSTFAKVLKEFQIVHIHPNNAGDQFPIGNTYLHNILEVTFLRKDLVKENTGSLILPHPLDQKNLPNLPEAQLDKMWIAHQGI